MVGGGIQVGVTWAVGFGAAMMLGLGVAPAVVVGVAVALSSTAVSMKSLQDFGKSASPSSRTTLAIALFQDILVILFMLLMPAFLGGFGRGSGVASAVGFTVLNAGLFLGAVWLLARWVIPRLMLAVSRARSRELFTLADRAQPGTNNQTQFSRDLAAGLQD